jgi:hypothetical protein
MRIVKKGTHERLGKRQREVLDLLAKAVPSSITGFRCLQKWELLKLMFPKLDFSDYKQTRDSPMKGRYFKPPLLNNARVTYARVIRALERKELIYRMNPGKRQNEEILTITDRGLKKLN